MSWQLDPAKGFGPVSGAAAGAVVAAAAAAWADSPWVELSPWWMFGGGALIGVVAGVMAVVDNRSARCSAWRALCWVGAGAWAAAWVHIGHWFANPLAWLTLIIGATVAAITASAFANEERDARAYAEKRAARLHQASNLNTEEDRLAEVWEYRLAMVAGVGTLNDEIDPVTYKPLRDRKGQKVRTLDPDQRAQVVAVEFWPIPPGSGLDGPPGYTLDVDLPEGGKTWADVARSSAALAGDARLPKNCGVSVEEGVHRGAMLIKVQTTNMLHAGEVSYPHSAEDDTIENPIGLGVAGDGKEVELEIARTSTVICAVKDAGKTNALQVIGKGVTRCVDTIVIDIDKSGGLSRPWVRPYVEGRAVHSVIHYPCKDDIDAFVACTIALRIAEQRKAAYGDIMVEAMVPIAPSIEQGGVPLLVIRVDEGGTLSREVRELLTQISDIGRGARVTVIYCALRGVDNYIPTALLAQCENRIALRVSDPTELHFIFGHALAAMMDRPPQEPGAGRISQKGELTDYKHYYALRETEIDAWAVAVAGRRPGLDPESLRVADEPVVIDQLNGTGFVEALVFERPWSTRLERALPKLFPGKDLAMAGVVPPASPVGPHTAGPGPTAGGSPVSTEESRPRPTTLSGAMTECVNSIADLGTVMDELERVAQEAERRREQGLPEVDEADLASGGPPPVEPPAPAGQVPDSADALLAAWATTATPAPTDIGRDVPRPPTADPPAAKPTAGAHLTPGGKRMLMLELIEEETDGVLAGGVIAGLRSLGVTDADQTIYGWLAGELKDGRLDQPWGRGPGAWPKGNYVITAAGREALRQWGEGGRRGARG